MIFAMILIISILLGIFLVTLMNFAIGYSVHKSMNKDDLVENETLYKINFEQFMKMFKKIKNWERDEKFPRSFFNMED